EARAQAERRESAAAKWACLQAWVWRQAPGIALVAGIAVFASGEYKLAVLAGVDPSIAPAVPVTIDVYAVSAFRSKREIPQALMIMFAANVAAHVNGIPRVGLTIAVVTVIAIIIWRVHMLLDHKPDEDANTQVNPFENTSENTENAPVENASPNAPQNGTAPPAFTPSAEGGADTPNTGSGNPAPGSDQNAADRSRARQQRRAKTAKPNRDKDAEDRAAARAEVRAARARGESIGPRALARSYGRSPSWGQAQIAAATAPSGQSSHGDANSSHTNADGDAMITVPPRTS
ncbi:hypothetical protein LUZ64_34855, partial [Streptomyces albireticuli]|nr:hypothetical protein [Streptomyces albireticuli]